MAFEKQKTFSIESRMSRWSKNNFNQPRVNGFKQQEEKQQVNILSEFEE